MLCVLLLCCGLWWGVVPVLGQAATVVTLLAGWVGAEAWLFWHWRNRWEGQVEHVT